MRNIMAGLRPSEKDLDCNECVVLLCDGLLKPIDPAVDLLGCNFIDRLLAEREVAIEKTCVVPHGARLVLALTDREEEGFCFINRWCCFGLAEAKLPFGKDGFRLGACIFERDNPDIRYLDPLRLGASGQHVAHAPVVHTHSEALEALVDVSYLLPWGWPQPP